MPSEGITESGLQEEEIDLTAGKAVEDVGVRPTLEDGLDSSQTLGSISEEAKHYIQYLKQKVASVTKVICLLNAVALSNQSFLCYACQYTKFDTFNSKSCIA